MVGIGDKFQLETKYSRENIGHSFKFSSQPDLYKTYPKSKRFPLPVPNIPDIDLNKSIETRKSIRSYSDEPMTINQLSNLLWVSTGIQRSEHGFDYRTAPSAGALYPIETYIVVNNIENLENGVYHYNIKNHLLEQLKQGNFGKDIAHAALDQNMCAKAAVVFIWAAIFQRSKWKYEQRAYRYIYLDAGHIAQNLALTTAGLKLGCCHIAALYDDEVNKIIEVDGVEESTIYMSVVGNLR